jgi:serine/threonine protein kinase
MKHYITSQENTTYNEMLFFPFISGNNLYITMTYFPNKNPKEIFMEIGKVIAYLHIFCMKHNNEYDSFIKGETNYIVQKALIHDDWQATNIMITPENKPYFYRY